jgi:hypothetical protein
MARVIWLVFFVEVIRFFMSRNDATGISPPYRFLFIQKDYSDFANVFLNAEIAFTKSSSAGRSFVVRM